jgi:hypothetical protein
LMRQDMARLTLAQFRKDVAGARLPAGAVRFASDASGTIHGRSNPATCS